MPHTIAIPATATVKDMEPLNSTFFPGLARFTARASWEAHGIPYAAYITPDIAAELRQGTAVMTPAWDHISWPEGKADICSVGKAPGHVKHGGHCEYYDAQDPKPLTGPFNPRYACYAQAHGRTPQAMLAHDREKYHGGCVVGFTSWMSEQWNQFMQAFHAGEPEQLRLCRPGFHGMEFDRWLQERTCKSD